MKKIRIKNWNLWIAWGAIIVVIWVFLTVFFNLYIRDRNTFILKMNNVLELSVQQFNSKLLEKENRGIVSSNGDSTFLILRDNKKYICNYDKGMDYHANFYRAIYDVIPPDLWNIKHLPDIIQYKMSEHCPPFVLIHIDSTGHTMKNYIFKIKANQTHNLQYEHTIPLGFLDKHQLKVYYTYPWQIFWELEKKTLSVIFFSLSLITICIWLFVRVLWNARKKAENQELLVQALNHDMKSPVAALQMRMYQIKKCSVAPYSPEQNKLYDQTCQQIQAILASTDRVLQDSIDAKGVHLNLEEVNLQELIEKQVTEITETADGKKKVEITTSFQFCNPVIRADLHHLSRAILNLLQNAVKYSGENVHIRITCREENKSVQIMLQDNGFGITKSDLKHVFERNYRSEDTDTTQKTKGFGVGLSYVKMIVRAHRGTIRAESEPGKGTTFIIKLRHGRKN